MSDSHPKHKVDQVGTPGHGDVLAARTDADEDLIGPAGSSQKHPHDEHQYEEPIAAGRDTQGIQYGLVNLGIGKLG